MEFDGLSPQEAALNDDLDDPIEEAYEVYLNRISPSEGTPSYMYLLQYPLRPKYRPYGDHGQLSSIERGNESGKLRLTYSLNVDGNEYSESKRKLLAEFLQRKEQAKLEEEEAIQLENLKNARLIATEAKNQGNCDYGLAFRRDKQIFITPVSMVLQFRPDFSHQDRLDDLKQQRASEHKMSVSRKSVSMADEDNPTTVEDDSADVSTGQNTPKEQSDTSTTAGKIDPRSISASASSTHAINSRLKMSFAELRAHELRESYAPIETVYDSESREGAEAVHLLSTFTVRYLKQMEENISNSNFNNLFFGEGDGAVQCEKPKYTVQSRRERASKLNTPKVICDNSHEKYLEALCKGCALLSGGDGLTTSAATEAEGTVSDVGTGPLSYLALSKLELPNQVRRIVKLRHIEKYSEIRDTVTAKRQMKDVDFINILKKFALPVKGNWIVLSEVLYDNSYPEDAGLKSDFIRSKWIDVEMLARDLAIKMLINGTVERNKLQSLSKCPMASLNKILESMCVIRNGKFVLKLESDHEFIKQFGTVCERIEAEWTQKIKPMLSERLERVQKQFEAVAAESTRGTGKGSTLIETLGVERVQRYLSDILKKHGASSEDFILKILKDMILVKNEEEVRSNLATAMSMGGNVSGGHLLSLHNETKAAVEKLDIDAIKEVLINCATCFK